MLTRLVFSHPHYKAGEQRAHACARCCELFPLLESELLNKWATDSAL